MPEVSAFRNGFLCLRLIAKALHNVIIHHSSGLHEGVADGGTDEVEATFLQIFTHRVRFWSAGRKSLSRPPGIYTRFASNELPDVAIKRAELFLRREKRFGILDRRRDLQSVAYDPLIPQQLLGLPAVVGSNFLRIESIKSCAIIFALTQNRVPAKPGLRALQNQELEQHSIVMLRNSPFAVVIRNR